jgi:hypothetical protein
VARQSPPIARNRGSYSGSVSKDILIVGHRVPVVTGFVGVRTRQPIGRGSGRRVVPGAEVARGRLEAAGRRLEAFTVGVASAVSR